MTAHSRGWHDIDMRFRSVGAHPVRRPRRRERRPRLGLGHDTLMRPVRSRCSQRSRASRRPCTGADLPGCPLPGHGIPSLTPRVTYRARSWPLRVPGARSGTVCLMSTVSVYRGWPVEPLSEASRCSTVRLSRPRLSGRGREDGPTRYSYQSGCELAVTSTFGPGAPFFFVPAWFWAARVCRPTAWWLNRVAAGGRCCPWIARQVNPAGRRSRSRRVRDPVSRRRGPLALTT